MTLYEFNLLPYERQLVVVIEQGGFLATRWEEEDAVNLYHLPGGVFVELYYNTHTNTIVRLRSFISTTPLEDYVVGVELSDL